ncbi:uncharacterized protein LOC110464581 [Mizuhopecten yessoensis]|uniref:uncharacterized protein LOC110446034 n=1 Tax=Mizuhopecten yessoensis TaxID=6573 RepID=UPI000B458E2F|nr:uncharacterized protein LOC110446034 [Mizuhopecten yessoensis]XP_021375535.1 uncharacterized protein LOC110464581 [Mizuhopecten yessoensis]
MWECQEMKEQILALQSRSMKDNLLFGGIPEQSGEENTEGTVKEFIQKQLEIESDMNFSVVHRLRPRSDGKPRTIIAKFENRKDREMVLKSAPVKLRGKNEFTVNEQFPAEINERRRELIPIMKEAKRHGKRATLRVDKLYVDGQLYTQPLHPQTPSQQRRPPSQLRFPSHHQDQTRHVAPPGATGHRR